MLTPSRNPPIGVTSVYTKLNLYVRTLQIYSFFGYFPVAPRIERDPDQYDYTSVAGLAGLGASAHLRFCAQPSSNSLVSPIRPKPPLQRRKTMVTMLADQIPEEESEEESLNEAVEECPEAAEETEPQSSKVGSCYPFCLPVSSL